MRFNVSMWSATVGGLRFRVVSNLFGARLADSCRPDGEEG